MTKSLLPDNWRDEIIWPNWAHQEAEFEHRDAVARALHWQMRTGKTKAMCDLASYQRMSGNIDGVLIMAPNNVHLNWIRKELGKHMWLPVEYSAMAWNSEALRTDPTTRHSLVDLLAYPELSILAMNVEASILPDPLSYLLAFSKKRKFLLITDESHEWRSTNSRRWKLLANKIAPRASFRRNLSGTMVDNSPLHAYPQYQILQPGVLGDFKTLKDFEEFYATWTYDDVWTKRKGKSPVKRKIRKVAGWKNQEVLRERMATITSYVSRGECVDLPELVTGEQPVILNGQQKYLYNEMVKKNLIFLDNGDLIDEAEGAKLITRLQQLCSGYVFDEDGELIELYPPEECPRLDVLVRLIKETKGKSIVFARYVHDIKRIKARLAYEKIKHVDYYGGTPTLTRPLNEDKFQNDPTVQVLVGQPQACGQGLDFSAGSHIIWFSHLHGNLIVRRQADERATAVGGVPIPVTDLVAVGTVDEKILADRDAKIETTEFLTGEGLRKYLELIP